MDLGKRMKEYESVSKNFLTRRMPVIIRIDGKAFHTFTRGFEKPFDTQLSNVMQSTMLSLCENIQGCVLGYTQSDEISLLLTDWTNDDTSAWFDNNVQKMVSISASVSTLYFNRFFNNEIDNYFEDKDTYKKIYDAYIKSAGEGALFDSRVFSLPKEEVCNYFIWRQQDATRNSVQMLAQANFSHKELQGKNNSEIQDMLMLQKNINWNDVETKFKRGSCAWKKLIYILTPNGTAERKVWVVDNDVPIFTQDRQYIENLIR